MNIPQAQQDADQERGARIIQTAIELMKTRRIGWSKAIEEAHQQVTR
jgi:hypothetical protein